MNLPRLRWYAVPASVSCEGKTLEEGTVYVRTIAAKLATGLAAKHVHDTWGTADPRIDYKVTVYRATREDETDERFNRPETVFTEECV